MPSGIDRLLPLRTRRSETGPYPNRPPAAEQRVAISLGAVVLLLLALDCLALTRDGVDRGFRRLVLPVLLLCAHVLVVDFWARPSG